MRLVLSPLNRPSSRQPVIRCHNFSKTSTHQSRPITTRARNIRYLSPLYIYQCSGQVLINACDQSKLYCQRVHEPSLWALSQLKTVPWQRKAKRQRPPQSRSNFNFFNLSSSLSTIWPTFLHCAFRRLFTNLTNFSLLPCRYNVHAFLFIWQLLCKYNKRSEIKPNNEVVSQFKIRWILVPSLFVR